MLKHTENNNTSRLLELCEQINKAKQEHTGDNKFDKESFSYQYVFAKLMQKYSKTSNPK